MNQCLVFFYHYYPTGSNMNNQVQTENKYFQSRMQLLGITAENNKIGIKHTSATEVEIDANGVGTHKITIIDVPIFRPHERGIEIMVYNLERNFLSYTPENARHKKRWSIIRLEHPFKKDDGTEMKYQMPKGAGSFPFFPPTLVDKYEKKQKIQHYS
jgi:hypothetical protein